MKLPNYPTYESTLPKMGELIIMADGRKFKVKSVHKQTREDDVIGAHYEFRCTAQEVIDDGSESVQETKEDCPPSPAEV